MYLEQICRDRILIYIEVSISFGDLMYLELDPRSLPQPPSQVSISFGDLMYLELAWTCAAAVENLHRFNLLWRSNVFGTCNSKN